LAALHAGQWANQPLVPVAATQHLHRLIHELSR
jgi:hypothetical protein